MKTSPKYRKLLGRKILFQVGLMLCFAILSLFSMDLLQKKLLENAQQVGKTLCSSYTAAEERNLIAYETLIRLGAQNMDNLREYGSTREQIQQWMQAFSHNVEEVAGENTVDIYAVMDGEIVAATPWEGDADYNYNNTAWYTLAVQAQGEVIFTDAYIDAIYEKPVITIAVQCQNSQDVLAFDVFPENFRMISNGAQLPEDASYFLCDSKGLLLYAQTALQGDREVVQTYLNGLLPKIESGELQDISSYIYDAEGKRRAVYYHVSENGWISIVTVPYGTILGDLERFLFYFGAVFAVFLLGVLLMGLREYLLNARMERTNETIRVLGNSYYAIYRINFDKASYEIIKTSDDMCAHLPQHGNYADFLLAAGRVIEQSAYQEFLNCFSIQNIRSLVARRVRDFGGDFLRDFDGEYKWVDVRLLFDESLSQGEAVLCFREVGEEKQRRLEQMKLLESSLRAARKSEASQNRFFSAMSHDMRTPLNAIIGLTDLAKGQLQNPEKLSGYLKKIEYSGHQLLDLINDILEMSRMEHGGITLTHDKFSLKECLQECASVFRVQAEEQGKTFRLTFDIRQDQVNSDAFRLTQVVNNLLSNALKFTKSGDEISLAVKQVENQRLPTYQIIVSDTGAGMSESFLDRIFEPYERETHFGAKNVMGTGLGMSIVKNIVSQMNGTIVVESTLHQGSRFTVTLPMESVRQEPMEPAQSESAQPEPGEQEPAGQEPKKLIRQEPTELEQPEAVQPVQPAGQERTQLVQPEPERTAVPAKPAKAPAPDTSFLKGKLILLAEDNEINREIATELLKMYGAQVVQAYNGREALEKFRESPPFTYAAILMDMQMPEMDGCEAAKAIRTLDRPDAKKVPIVAVTANAFAEDIAKTTAAGMDAHICKPIDFPSLFRMLSGLMEKEIADNERAE